MEKLNLPSYDFKITRKQNSKLMIFDPYRKINIQLTPEEWVRQHILKYLIEERGFPPSLISVESGIRVNRFLRRYDALVYSRNRQPLLLIECKAPAVKISQKTFDQIVLYNRSIKAMYLLITNGMNHFCCKLNELENKFDFIENIPHFDHLLT